MSNDNQKCAPMKKFEGGSCFTIDDLLRLSHGFNDYIKKHKINKKPITIFASKKYLLKELIDRFKEECGDSQICILDQPFVKEINDETLVKNTFRPKGPQKKFDWLSTTNIDEVMEQYESIYPDFMYLGTVPIDFDDLPLGIKTLNFDELYNKKKYRLGIIFNLDEHYKSGSHWIGLFANIKDSKIYFFDSFGVIPDKRIIKFIIRIAKWCYKKHFNKNISDTEILSAIKKNIKNNQVDIRYNTIQHQFKDSECGVYSLHFIIRMLEGINFDDLTENIIKDDKMNKNREIFFRHE